MTTFTHEGVTLILGDCLEHMARMADGAYSLAVVDPPFPMYSIGGGDLTGKLFKSDWYDKVPGINYFSGLQRVSTNQIIWGANYFTNYLPPNNNLIVWYKNNQGANYSMAELAWCSIQKNSLVFEYRTQKTRQQIDCYDHPCPKPTALYRWLLQNYARPGDTILDTHLGSGSSAIAAWEMGYTFTGIEIDEDYYHAAVERFKRRIAQPYLPGLVQPARVDQVKLI